MATQAFDSVRNYVDALDRRGRLLHIDSMDQDQYEISGFAYRLLERYGPEEAPAFMVGKVRIDGEWREGPVLANLYGNWPDEALLFGITDIVDDQHRMYRAVIDALMDRLDEAGMWRRIPPVEVDASQAPCKEVLLTGEQIDIESFAWLKSNPADAGRYINMGSVFIQDPELGSNVGTYRCQVKGPRKIGVNPEPGQHGWLLLNEMKRRGDKVAKVAVAVAPDPLTFCASSTKMAGYREDELEFVGGLRGSPLPVVRCETCDIRVPAHSEFIIEGEVPLDEFEPEGPYGEMYGFQGPKKDSNFFMHITAVTHRRDPWVLNSFTGLTWDMPKAPQVASNFFRYKRMIPNLTGFYTPGGANGVVVISIDKRFPGQGMSAGQHVAANPALNKVVIVVDDDVDIMDPGAVLKALGARWQPSASVTIPQTQMMMPDPSRPVPMLSSKIVIDATRQMPQEGGPEKWPAANRELLVKGAPGIMERIDQNWERYFSNWKK
ncbi:MAG TPA: UbiD family decarboxylase [Chromatiales bacterium]|nr:UbiD family decarboxylase [Chromatiales bacterium]